MFVYQKKLQYPVNIKKRDLNFAKRLITQYGGSNGELGAAIRYLNQRYTMPDNKGKALLTDIALEELGHVEMICTMIYQLTNGASVDELKSAGFDDTYTEHGFDLFPVDSNGVVFSATTIASTGDYMANLMEDMAAEEKARATYENLIDIAEDKDVLGPLLWLRQREILHYNLFKELRNSYMNKPTKS